MVETQSLIQVTSITSSILQSTINLETTAQPLSVNTETQPTGASNGISENATLIAAACVAMILAAVMWLILRKKRVKSRGTEIYLEDRAPSRPSRSKGTEIFGDRTEEKEKKSKHEES
jgi:hypothetical protein